MTGEDAGADTGSALTATCHGCGARGADRVGVADLAVLWLVLDDRGGTAGGLAAVRFCRACSPRGAVGELACAGCGDGPLLAGALADAEDLATAAAIDAWLTATGWRPAGPWCPACARVVHARPARLGGRGEAAWGSGAS